MDYTINRNFIFSPNLMKNKILSYLLGWFFAILLGLWSMWSLTYAQEGVSWWGWWWDCNWIKLNTNFPIIWNCISTSGTKPTEAFPYMIWALTKIVISLVLVACFILIIYAGILWASDKPKEAKDWLKRVAITILLLWFSWVILKIINPNFFNT